MPGMQIQRDYQRRPDPRIRQTRRLPQVQGKHIRQETRYIVNGREIEGIVPGQTGQAIAARSRWIRIPGSSAHGAKTAAGRSRCPRTRRWCSAPAAAQISSGRSLKRSWSRDSSSTCVEMIGESFRSVFKGWGTFLKRRRVRRVLGAALALLALSLLFYGIDRGRQSPDGFLNKNIDITFNSPASGDDTSTDRP